MKKYIVLSLLIICIFTIAGCGKRAPDNPNPPVIDEGPEESEINVISEDSVSSDDSPYSIGEADAVPITSDLNFEPGETEPPVEEVEPEPAIMEDPKPEEAAEPVVIPDDFVNDLSIAGESSQIMTVAATGSSAVLKLHNKNADGYFEEVLSTNASIGKNGIGKTKEGDKKTPTGKYSFIKAFGIKDNPGSQIAYTKVNSTHFWVDDSNSSYYNQFVSTDDVTKDWSSAENLSATSPSYNYALAINYNSSCVPGKGSAIFIHCKPTGGAGCIAVEESVMKRLVQETTPGCILLIDTPEGLKNY